MSPPSVSDLLERLRAARVDLWLDGAGALKFKAPKGALTPALRAEIAERRAAVIAALAVSRPGHAQASEADITAPLSPGQSRFLMIEELADVGSLHTIGGAVRLIGHHDLAALQTAWTAVLQAHPALRTRFEQGPEGPVQRISQTPRAALRVHSANISEAEAERASRAFTATRIDPFGASCVHGALWVLGPERAYLAVALHHAVGDGWSVGIFLEDLASAYDTACAEGRAALPPRAGYHDLGYDAQSPREAERRDWWRARLAGRPPHIDLIADHPRPAVQSFLGAQRSATLSPEEARRVRDTARAMGISTFALLSATFGALIMRHAGASEMLLGVGVSGRETARADRVIGPFVNTLPVPLGCDWGRPAADFLRASAAELRACLAHQTTPFNVIVEDQKLARDVSRPPLVQVLVTEQMAQGGARLGDLDLEPLHAPSQTARMDLYLSLEWAEDGALCAELEFALALFEPATAAAILDQFIDALCAIVEDATRPLFEALLGLKKTGSSLSGAPLLQTALGGLASRALAMAEAHPDRVALLVEETPGKPDDLREVSYRGLADAAEDLALRLFELGIKEGDLVAIDMHRSYDFVVATLAVIFAGAAYLPLDADHPDPRWPDMLARAGVRLTLRHGATRDRAGGPPSLFVDREETVERLAEAADRDPVWANAAPGDAPTYVMFTSGSTGAPKAVAVSEGAVLRLVDGVSAAVAPPGADISPGVMLMASSTGFDAATLELWVPLLTGATLAMAPPGPQAPDDLAAFLRRARVDTAWFTSGLFNALVEAVPEALAALDTIIAGGDRLSAAHVTKLLERMRPGARVINGFGPTETTTFATLHPMRAGQGPGAPIIPASVPLGQPIGGTEINILDAALRPVPPGALGEIVIGGAGLAAGYLGDAERTSERFRALPYRAGRHYLTGDLGRIGPGGALEYLGRRDAQIKLRGFRIDLAEIEAALADEPAIASAAATLIETNHGKILAAYVVPESGQAPREAALLEALAAKLPDYMVPNRIMALGALPIGKTGKLDRRLLPAPKARRQEPDRPPEGPAETALAEIWAQALGLDQASLGASDGFFSLGGDSIVAMQVAHRLKARGWALRLVDLVRAQRLDHVARAMTRLDAAPALFDEPGPVPLSPIQAELLPAIGAKARFAQSVWLSLATSPETAALEAALATLTAHHRGLSFAFDQGRAALGAPRAPELLTFSVGTPPEEIEARVIDALDLARGATLAAGRVGGDLFLAGHHAVTDIATWRFLLSDLAHLLEEPDAPLAPVPSWRGYLSALKDRATAQRRDAERLPPSDVASVPAALRDRLAHATRADLAAGSGQVAGDELEGLLGVLARHPALRLEDALTAGLSAVLQARVGAAGRRIDLERHGRDIPGVDALGLAGWCTLFCPLLLDKGQAATGAALFAAASVRRAMPDEGKLWLAWKWSSEDDATRARARAVPPALALVNLQRSDFSERRHEAARPGAFRLLERNAAGMIGDDVPFSHPLELNARLEEGALCFDILAHPALGAADGIARALADWLGALSGAEMEHVASDVRLYPQAPWSQNQLSEAEARWRRRAPETRFEDVLPLSPQQYGMQIEALAGEASAQHVEQVALTFESPLDEERLESAWARVVAAHPALRTVFVESQGDWAQIVLRHGPRPVSRGDTPLERVARDEMRAFAPDETAFIRLVLCEGGRGLVLTVHHAILDGWSLARVLADIALAYGDEAHAMAYDPGMAPYLAWLGDRVPDADFWQEWEEALPAWSRIEPAERSAARTVARVLSAQLVERISATARGAGLSPAALSQVALAAVLMADEGRAETAFFVTDAGRPEALPESAEAVGLFIATLPIAFRAQSAPPLEAARAMAGKLREAVGQWPPTPLKRPVSDVLLVFENYPTAGETSGAGMARISDVKSTGARTRFPLTFLVIPGETWRIDCVHNPAQIGAAQVAALLTSYEAALDALTGEGATWESVTAAANSAFGGQRLPRRDAKALERLSVSPDEAELADIWEKVLGHKAFGLEDRFDQAGGHSLGLLHLATEIDKRLGKKIAVSALAAAPTLRSQARLLSDEPIAGRSAVSPLRLMQAQAGRSPKLLILPGAAGEPSAYRALQEELPADWHIEIASYEAPGAPDALAQALAQALADRRDAPARPPAGPWTILGHSFGAALAASVAARLGKRAIKSLLLLDQPTPDLAPASPERSDETLASEIAEAARRYHGKEVALGGGGTAPERLARALAHAGLLADRGASAEIGTMIIARYRAALDGLEGWRPPKLDVPVCILRASESEATGPIEDPSLGWARVSGDEPRCVTVPGDHISVLRAPAVKGLGAAITAFLREKTEVE